MSVNNSDYVQASFDTIHEQAPMAAANYLRAARREIDELFGEGYAAKHPELVAAFIQSCAAEMSSATIAKVQGAALQEIASQLGSIASALESE